MPSYAYANAAWTVDRLIRKYGFHEKSKGKAYFRNQSGVLRICRAVESDFDPRDIDGVIIQRTDRRFLVSTKTAQGPLHPPPDDEEDVLVIRSPDTEGVDERVLVIQNPPKRLAPASVMIYWDLHVRSL